MTKLAVEVRDALKQYPNPGGGIVNAVDRVSLAIADGEFFSLLGPSGCGKSTLLRMIAGFERPTAGEIAIRGRVMGATPPYQRPVNMVFQSYALFPHMTVFQNIAFGLEMADRPKDEVRRRVDEALTLVQLPELGSRKPGQLSGGQQQRIALARALVNQPAVLLLDEPLGALDLKLRKEMQIELKALQQRVGITFIYVTHDQEEALAMSDRIAVMDQGRILQIGTPTVIYERPNCRFVADFIGEANFIEGRVTRLADGFGTMQVDGHAIELVGLAQGELSVGQAVTYSIRPEKIQARDEPPAESTTLPPNPKSTEPPTLPPTATSTESPATPSSESTTHRNCLPATVEDVAYIGSDTRILVRVDESLTLAVWEQNDFSTLDPEAYYHRGEAVWLTWRPENALLLGQ